MNLPKAAGKRRSYDFKFKQVVIKYAEKNSNREVAGKYALDESMIHRWRKAVLTSGAVVKCSKNGWMNDELTF